MTLQQFCDKYNGKAVDFDGYYGNQCVDLVQQYNKEMFNGPFLSGAGAKDIYNTYPQNIYTRIDNTPTGFPVPGDIVIWGASYGPWGHIAICTEADVNTFTCFSQNDPTGVLSGYKKYFNYNGVLGWLHPKQTIPPGDDCPAKLTQITAERDRLNRIIGEEKDPQIKRLEETIANLNTTINDKNNQITKLTSDISTLQGESANLSERITSLTEQSLKVKPLEEQVAELERQKKLWGELETSYKQQINGYKVKWDLIKLPYTKLLKKLLIDRLI